MKKTLDSSRVFHMGFKIGTQSCVYVTKIKLLKHYQIRRICISSILQKLHIIKTQVLYIIKLTEIHTSCDDIHAIA